MPRIAIAQCAKLPDYEESIRRAGGEVRVLDRASDRPTDVIAGVDGVLLTGGGDVQPSIYGATPHPRFDAAEPGREGEAGSPRSRVPPRTGGWRGRSGGGTSTKWSL